MIRSYDQSKWKQNPIYMVAIVIGILILGWISYSNYSSKTTPSIRNSKKVGYSLKIGGGGGYNDFLTMDYVQYDLLMWRTSGATFREENEYLEARLITGFEAHFFITSENDTSCNFHIIGDSEFSSEFQIKGNGTVIWYVLYGQFEEEDMIFVSPRNKIEIKLIWEKGYRVGITCESYILFSWLQAENPPFPHIPYITENWWIFILGGLGAFVKFLWSAFRRSYFEQKLEELIKEVQRIKKAAQSKKRRKRRLT